MVGEPVQQRAGEAFRAEDLGPLVAGAVFSLASKTSVPENQNGGVIAKGRRRW